MTSKIVTEFSSTSQESNAKKSKSQRVHGIPIYRVTLVQEGKVQSYRKRIANSSIASNVLRSYIADADREHFVVLLLDRKYQIIGINTVSIGSLTGSTVHPREVFKPAILCNADSIICGHNHLSGDPGPSREDRAITKRLVKSGKMLGIDVLDHVIIGNERHFSFADEGLMAESLA